MSSFLSRFSLRGVPMLLAGCVTLALVIGMPASKTPTRADGTKSELGDSPELLCNGEILTVIELEKMALHVCKEGKKYLLMGADEFYESKEGVICLPEKCYKITESPCSYEATNDFNDDGGGDLFALCPKFSELVPPDSK